MRRRKPRLSRNRLGRWRVGSLMKMKPKTRVPRGRRDGKPDDKDQNQATVDEFDREGMGVAPKE